MTVTEIGVKRPVLTVMLFLGFIVLGAISLFRLGIDLMPDIEVPTITVVTRYEGAGPQEVEARVTQPIEERLAVVADLEKLTSSSRQDLSVVTLRFKWGADLEEKANDVRDRLDLVRPRLPDEADDPYLRKFNLSNTPIFIIGVSAEESYPTLYDFLDKNVCKKLEKIPGVAAVDIRGGLERQIRVELDGRRLEAYRVSTGEIVAAIGRANLTLPAGTLKSGPFEYIIRTPGEVTVAELADTAVVERGGAPVRVRDVARVRDAFVEPTSDVGINRRRGLMLSIQKQSGSNTVRVADAALAELERLKAGVPADVRFHIVSDQSDFIRKSVANVRDSLVWAVFFVLVVILFFIRDVRSSLIVAVSVPVSLVTTFLLMYLAGFTLNTISLASLAICVGMVVDAAIVVFENIFRHRDEGAPLRQACLDGSGEVAAAVIASVFSIVVVFIPIIFVGGVTRVVFSQLALTISFALLCSMVCALMLVPLLSNKFLHLAQEEHGWQRRFFQHGEQFFGRVSGAYTGLLRRALRNKRKVVAGSVLFLLASCCLVPFIGTRFIPESDDGRLNFNIELPIGTRYEETGAFVAKVEETLAKRVPEAAAMYSRWGVRGTGMGAGGGKGEASHRGFVGVRLVEKAKRRRSNRRIARDLRPFLRFAEGPVFFTAGDQMSSIMFGGGRPLNVEIRGHDLDAAREVSGQVKEILSGIRGVADVDISREEGMPEYQVKIDREKARQFGLSVEAVAEEVRTFFAGDTSNKYREAGEEYEIMVRLKPEEREDPTALEHAFIASPTGGLIRLSEVARIVPASGPVAINRRDQERTVEVYGEIYDRDLGSIVQEASEKFARIVMPPDFSIAFTGEREEQAKAFRALFFALLMGVAIVYMVMASQFESLIDPFIIMFSVPFALAGVVWGLLLFGESFSLQAFLGVLMLVGIVEEVGIVYITFVIMLRGRGMALEEAVVKAGQLRLRPILMTSLTTILGVVPMVLARNEGSEMFRPLAVVIIAGLFAALITSLVLIPVLYCIFEERIKKPAGHSESTSRT